MVNMMPLSITCNSLTFLDSGEGGAIWLLLKTFANCLDPEQDRMTILVNFEKSQQ